MRHTMLQNIILKAVTAVQSRKGVTALEYGILAAAIIGGIAAVVNTVGGDISGIFNYLAGKLTVPG